MTARVKAAALAALIAIWFLGQTWRGLFMSFTEDDLMNMYAAWNLPLAKLAVGLLTPFTSVYRPVGSLFYRILYTAVGLNPLPFRIAAYALMLLNIWLLYRLIRVLTGSAETALLCALIASFHNRLFGLFVNGGTIYDILCFTFFCLAFTTYASTREKHKIVTGWPLLGFCVLYSLALNSKEMAASLPPILLAYELIYQPIRRLTRWFVDRMAIWIAAVMTLLAFKLKTAASSSFYGVPDYVRTFSLHQYFSTAGPLTSQVFFLRENTFTPVMVLGLFTILWIFALMMRSKPLILAAAIIILAPLPINFIPYRGFFVMYLPLIGWTLYLGVVLILIKDRLARIAPWWIPLRTATFLATALVLFTIQSRNRIWTPDFVDPNMVLIRNLRADLLHMRTSLPPNAKVAFLPSDPFPPDTWNTLYVVRLLYKSPAIAVERPQVMPADPQAYALILDYRDRHYVNLR